jgi:hypothetical protein
MEQREALHKKYISLATLNMETAIAIEEEVG